MEQIYTRRGFTLIELLVVVLIIGILAAVVLPQYQVAVGKSRFMEIIAVGNAIYKAEKVYFLHNGSYTDDLAALDLEISAHPNLSININTEDKYLGMRVQKLNAYYIHYFVSGRRECRATDNIGRKICASLTSNKENYIEELGYWVRKL